MLPPGLPVYHTDLFVPRYRPLTLGRWRVMMADMTLSRGYWSDATLVVDLAALLRDGSTWMSTSPMELESQEIGIRLARGDVLVCGLGMGWCAVNCALQEDVRSVTVVEIDPDVLALHRELDILSQLPAEARAKIRIVEGDALDFRPDGPVDLLMPDIWQPLMEDGRIADVQRMQANVGAAHVYFWGQELEIARHAVAAGRALDGAGIQATVAGMGLPLLGPRLPDYPHIVQTVAAHHMRDRWLTDARPAAPAGA